MKKFFFSAGPRDTPTSIGLLVMRVGIGAMMAVGHGFSKLSNWSKIVEDWKSPDFPPLSWMSPQVSFGALVFAELVCGALIVLGLVTRPAAAVLGFAMAVAAFYAHAADPWFLGKGGAKEPALLYLVCALALLAAGAGRFSVDAVVTRDKRRWGR